MTWYSVLLSPNDISAGKHSEMQRLFGDLFVPNATQFPGAALLTRKDSNVTGRYIYYFSPDAALFALHLIHAYAGIECEAPLRSEVKLIIGHSGADKVPLRES